ncbi:MAG: hypothetical protein R3E08_04670 [Thiotrichaceae bacterium]
MIIYNDNEAQQNFSQVLEQATHEEVWVRRADGVAFAIVPKPLEKSSPFAVAGIKNAVTTADILETLRDMRGNA